MQAVLEFHELPLILSYLVPGVNLVISQHERARGSATRATTQN